MNREEIVAYIKDIYSTDPEYPWANDPSAVFRHLDNRKWFALLMRIPKNKLKQGESGNVDVLNLKCDSLFAVGLCDGIYPAYHMSKTKWVSIDIESAEDEVIKMLLSVSFSVTEQRKKGKQQRKKGKQ